MGQAAAAHLEAVRRSLASLGLPRPDEGRGPVVVLLLPHVESLWPYAPGDSRDPALTRGLSLAGEDQSWIAIAWDAPGNVLAALTHEYAHLSRTENSDPLWFREGLAEYVAGLSVSGTGGTGQAFEHHLRVLREQPWIAWDEFFAADRMSAAFASPNFYSQAWLALDWLARRGTSLAQLKAADMDSIRRVHGQEWMQAELRTHAEQLWTKSESRVDGGGQDLPQTPDLTEHLETRPMADWELPYWEAEFHRELDHRDRAQLALEVLEQEYPAIPEPSASLGALAIAQGRYALAETKLRAAIAKGSRSARAHHRYSLMLLQPHETAGRSAENDQDSAAATRVGRAIWHARQARTANPDEPLYLLGEAQALLVGGFWEPAARLLLELQRVPGWSVRCDEEFSELVRRRQQAMRRVPAPELPPGIDSTSLAASSGGARVSGGPSPLVLGWLNAAPPRVPKPGPPAKPKFVWPPPGTVLLYGYITGVECRASEKIVTVRTPRLTIELREKGSSPAKLYRPPSQWTALPCGLRGREVNVVYRPLPPGGEVRGELVAVVF
jgi:hypothetical protein